MWTSLTAASLSDKKRSAVRPTINALLCHEWCSSFISRGFRARTSTRSFEVLGGFRPVSRARCHGHHRSRTKGVNSELFGIFLCLSSLWFIIQLPSNMFQLGSDFCWGLAAAVANRQLNIYILLSSGKQTLFWGSAVWAVKSLYLCACLHNFYNIFMPNECKFYLNHDPAQGLSGDKMHTHREQRDKSNNLFFLHKGLWNRGGHPLVKMVSCTGRSQWGQWRPHVVCKQRTGLAATEQGSSSGP